MNLDIEDIVSGSVGVVEMGRTSQGSENQQNIS